MPITLIMYNMAILRSTQLVSLSRRSATSQSGKHSTAYTFHRFRNVRNRVYCRKDRKLEEIAMIFLAIVLAKAALSDCRLLAKSFQALFDTFCLIASRDCSIIKSSRLILFCFSIKPCSGHSFLLCRA